MNTASVILASGSGLRFDAKDTPKHLTLILGIPIIVWTIDTVIRSKLFTSIVIVTREADITKTKNIIGKAIIVHKGEDDLVSQRKNTVLFSWS